MKKRQKSLHEQMLRDYRRQKKRIISKCVELGIAYYEVGQNDSELYATPDNYVCVLSPDDYAIGETFSESGANESIFVSLHDQETLELF